MDNYKKINGVYIGLNNFYSKEASGYSKQQPRGVVHNWRRDHLFKKYQKLNQNTYKLNENSADVTDKQQHLVNSMNWIKKNSILEIKDE